MIPKVEYLGHTISEKGIQPMSEKVRPIRDAPRPQDVSQLCSFLGMLNYSGKFLQNLTTVLQPLYDLLQSAKLWSWEESQERAFGTAKELLSSAPLLTHYDPDKPLVLSCDASPYGVGTILSHCMDDQTERPIAYTSRMLSPAELSSTRKPSALCSVLNISTSSSMAASLPSCLTTSPSSTYWARPRAFQPWHLLAFSVGH